MCLAFDANAGDRILQESIPLEFVKNINRVLSQVPSSFAFRTKPRTGLPTLALPVLDDPTSHVPASFGRVPPLPVIPRLCTFRHDPIEERMKRSLYHAVVPSPSWWHPHPCWSIFPPMVPHRSPTTVTVRTVIAHTRPDPFFPRRSRSYDRDLPPFRRDLDAAARGGGG